MALPSLYPIPSCAECGIQSAGRCPTCHHHLCIDHFPQEAHQPCASHLQRHAEQMRCYICGAQALPRQWSTAVFAHYSDSGRCAGCHRYVCSETHTAFQREDVTIRRDSLQSHRYHNTRRYCPTCARLRLFGGILGASWWLAGSVAVLAALVIVVHLTIH